MAVKKIIAYRTDDGTDFEHEADAERYDRYLARRAKIKATLTAFAMTLSSTQKIEGTERELFLGQAEKLAEFVTERKWDREKQDDKKGEDDGND